MSGPKANHAQARAYHALSPTLRSSHLFVCVCKVRESDQGCASNTNRDSRESQVCGLQVRKSDELITAQSTQLLGGVGGVVVVSWLPRCCQERP